MLAWVDVETTGLDDQALLLEVAIVVTDDDLTQQCGMSWVVHHHADVVEVHLTDWTRETHRASGLLDEVKACKKLQPFVEKEICDFLTDQFKDERPPMAGSTVSFDRDVLRRCMPCVVPLFHYRNVDVSSVKELVHRWYPNLAMPPKVGSHRAMEDILESIDLLRYFRKHVFVPLHEVVSG